MTFHRSQFLTAAIAFGIASCAQPARQAAVPETPVAAVKKPVRMNGRGKITSISLTELYALQQSDQVLLYDARPGFFYGLGHLPGAINLPKSSDCDAQIIKREAEIKAALAAKKTIVIYCTNLACPDARSVAIHLAGFGYPSSTLTGGWEAWKESGLPTE
jgi:3-mercaptopyruvate sulfurtransferase SseA